MLPDNSTLPSDKEAPLTEAQRERVVEYLPFVKALARSMAANMPHSLDIGDLVQNGVLGLMDAARRFDETRGVKFETFAERRVRGSMVDALRREAWPRGVRRMRRELEAGRETLRGESGEAPSDEELADYLGMAVEKLQRRVVRINRIESTSPHSITDSTAEEDFPDALVPSQPEAPDVTYEAAETRDRISQAIQGLPPRERKVVDLYYYQEMPMLEIGRWIGVNESRVSQLHARAMQRLRVALQHPVRRTVLRQQAAPAPSNGHTSTAAELLAEFMKGRS